MVFVADDLAAWLIGRLADEGLKRLTTLVLGPEQERALRPAATAAVQLTARDLRPASDEQAAKLAQAISQRFRKPMPVTFLAGQSTLLEALRAGIGEQLAGLADADPVSAGKYAAELRGVSAGLLTQRLTDHLVQEIILRGSRGGPLAPLANQLSHDRTYLQGKRLEGKVSQLDSDLRDTLARLDSARRMVAPVALAQLPAAARLTGRDAELAELAELLDPAGTGPTVSALAGLPGVGKTTLAVAAGHAARQRGWFGGGVLFLDLHGSDEVPTQPGGALDALLRALGVSTDRIPPDTEERVGLYWSVLARMSEPVLAIADNASSEAQVRSLLPGAGAHRVMVTSEQTLAGLSARLVEVRVLDDADAMTLLDSALRIARPGDDRIADDREAAERLARECGGLPLALQIAADLLIADPALRARADRCDLRGSGVS